jgi:hypothetical protein
MTNLKKLAQALTEVGTAPCDRCSFNVACRQGYACRVFRSWLITGNFPRNYDATKPADPLRPPEWRPDRQHFAKAFFGCPAQLKRRRHVRGVSA